jgi:hypothetical protein
MEQLRKANERENEEAGIIGISLMRLISNKDSSTNEVLTCRDLALAICVIENSKRHIILESVLCRILFLSMTVNLPNIDLSHYGQHYAEAEC